MALSSNAPRRRVSLEADLRRHWRKLGPRRAQDLLRRIAGDSGRVIFTIHVEQRQAQRAIKRREIMQCLRRGRVITKPYYEHNRRCWTFRVQGDVTNFTITCVVAIDEEAKAIVITAWRNGDEDDAEL